MPLKVSKDRRLVKDVDGMHFICPIIYPNRCDNEAFVSELIDLTNLDKYLKKKNKSNPEYKYNLFQVIVTAMMKVIYLRPQMNYFVKNGSLYEKTSVSGSFVIKKQFKDGAKESLAVLHCKPEYTLEDIHNIMYKKITEGKDLSKSDKSSDAMDILNKLPRFISKFIVHIIMLLDQFGMVPNSLIATDPYYTSVVFTNLGSIKLHSGYHHLTNWGTTSVFMVIGEMAKRPFYDEKGKISMRNSVDLGLTVDERIADGYYFSRSIALLKKLLENPELLEDRLDKEVQY